MTAQSTTFAGIEIPSSDTVFLSIVDLRHPNGVIEVAAR